MANERHRILELPSVIMYPLIKKSGVTLFYSVFSISPATEMIITAQASRFIQIFNYNSIT
ncbi:MAG TPA: hypothetical protein DEO70_08555 [Bacteroidales bacterium]|nr:MAG: hypothetical protein A2X11_16430 [Bacteroidetes bacterium GWE2_42_24]HBZ66877.1 hypothetical protein [Bacteroidales bacterium]